MSAGNLPLISIALCTYNGVLFLKEQLDSLANQTYPNLEIIICDDASSDQTYSLISSYLQVYKNVRVYKNESNIGFSKNFFKAIKYCKGEFIALCDQDDIWSVNKIEVLYRNIRNNILIYSDSQLIDENGNSINKKLSEMRRPVVGKKPKAFLFHNSAPGHTVMFDKKLLSYLNIIPENFFHDWWILYVANCIGTIAYVPECLVKYRQHNTSKTDVLQKRGRKRLENLDSKDRSEETRQLISHLNLFLNFKHTLPEDRKFINRLIKGYEDRLQRNVFSFKLFLTLITNTSLFYIERKNLIQKILFILKESLASKVKTSFHSIKKSVLKPVR